MTDIQENRAEKEIHLLYKNLGETPYQCVARFKAENPDFASVSMTYAGRLDPMAEGLLLVLSGSKVYEKETYLQLSKQYEFDVLWQCQTDTSDILGKIVNEDVPHVPEIDKVEKVLKESIGKFDQKYPAYSSQTVGGKSLIEWSRMGKIGEVEIPSHTVELISAKFQSRRFLSGKDLLSEIEKRVGLVTGDFRQEQIIAEWKNILTPKSDILFAVDTICVNVSGGFYVRQFISDMAEALGTIATTFHILRMKVGDFEIDL